MKKLVSVLLAVCMAIALLVPAIAAGENDCCCTIYALPITLAAIEEFNETHGGTGKLLAEVTVNEWGRTIVVITGAVTGATRGLEMHHWTDVIWRAKLHGNPADGGALINAGSIIVEDGADIISGGTAIRGRGHWVGVNGGVITAVRAICASGFGLEINGGIITGDIYRSGCEDCPLISEAGAKIQPLHMRDVFYINGGEINGSIIGWIDGIFGGIINAPSIHVAALVIAGDAQVNIECVAGLEHAIVSVAPTATENFTDRLTNWIRNDSTGAIVFGHVTRHRLGEPVENWWYGGLSRRLYIPKNTSLILESLWLDGGTIVIDGKLNLPANQSFDNWNGTVTGANAGNLAGTWENGVRTPPFRWYHDLPPFLHFILRYFLFGWLWFSWL